MTQPDPTALPGITASLESLEIAVREGRAASDPQRLLDLVPYARFLGLRCARAAERLIVTMRFAPSLIGDASIQALHGGTLAGLLESTAAFHALFVTEVTGMPKTISLTIDYLRSARAVDTSCEAVVIRQGRRFVVLQVTAYQDQRDAPVAMAVVKLKVG